MAERTVHYRSVDPIQNLKLRVVLTCRSGTNTDQPKEVPAGEAGAEVSSLTGRGAEGGCEWGRLWHGVQLATPECM